MGKRLGYKLRDLRKTYVDSNLIMISVHRQLLIFTFPIHFAGAVSTTFLLEKYRGAPIAHRLGNKI